MPKRVNSRFEEMLKISVQPFHSNHAREDRKKTGDYTDRKIHSHTIANASEKRSDMSR